MAVAASVKTVITIKGKDQASKSVKKSTTAMGKLQASMSKATAKSRALGSSLRNMATGNISGALSDVGGLLGGSGGIAAAATAATAATAALAVGVGVAAFKFTEWSSEIERARAALDNTFGGQGVEKAIAFAREIGGVGVDSVQKLATTLKASGINATITAKQMQELANRATQMGKSGDEALTAFADAVQKGTTRSLASVGVFISVTKAQEDFLEGTGRSAESMSQLEKQQAVLNAVTRDLATSTGASSAMYSKQDNTLARISIAWTELKFKVSEYLGGPAVGLLENVADTIEFFARFGKVLGAVTNFIIHGAVTAWKLWGTAVGGVAALIAKIVQGKSLVELGDHMDQVASDLKVAAIDDTATAFTAMASAIASVGTEAKKTVKQVSFLGSSYAFTEAMAAKFSAGIAKRAALEGKLAAKRAARRQRAAAWAAKRRAAQKAAAAADAKFFGDLANLQAKTASEAVARQRSEIDAMNKRKTDLQILATLENQLAQVKAANNPAELARLQNLQTEADLQQRIAEIKGNLSLEEGEQQRTIDAVRGIAHEKQMERLKTVTDAQRAANAARIQGFISTGKAAANALAEIGVAERAIAGIKAVMAGAEAFLAFSRYDFVAGIAATTAAVQFGKIALSSPDVPSGQSASPSTSAPGIQSPTPSGGGGTQSYNITINGVFATAAETGAAIKQAIGAASSTGMAGA
jgi:hypothetical protein